jgi:hypothetical protein
VLPNTVELRQLVEEEDAEMQKAHLIGAAARRKIDDSRILAEAIVKHLELCRLEVHRPPEERWHSTPG